ncbi:ASKHA domain-containing protein [Paracoccaceae bacterium GXU_MW_L88]
MAAAGVRVVGVAVADPLVIFTPSGKRGRFPVGTPVLTAARKLGVDLDSVCGGRGICSKCQVEPSFGQFPKHGVTVEKDALSPWNKVEARYDEKRGLKPGRRLGCQATVQSDVVIDVPAESQMHQQIVRKDATVRDITLDPVLKAHPVTLPAANMDDPTGAAERLRLALGAPDLRIPLALLTKLPATDKPADLTALTHGADLIDILPGHDAPHLYGLAVDLGSTTIAAHLCDLSTGAVLASAGIMNPQIRFGEDLMSRVSYAMLNEGGAAEMTRAVRASMNTLIEKLAKDAGITHADIHDITLVANPVMHHLFLGLDPVPLGQSPFALTVTEAQDLPAADAGLTLHPEARLYTLPLLAGHVGADAAAVILSEAPWESDEITLIVDVGTNAEIVLGNSGRVLACSSPTGPAFEGAQISSGQRAAPGAIERVRIDPETKRPRFKVIGDERWSDVEGFAARVTGICGSGIIEAIAEMRMAGLIDASGLIGSAEETGSDAIEADGRTALYVLHPGDENSPKIAVTQNDVRAIQLAKSALYAGARLLMDEFGTDHVDRVRLAGAFGAHISPLHAMVLGMIPDCAPERVTAVGNAAGTGARMALLSRASRAEIEARIKDVTKIETAIAPRFQEHFVASNHIPHATAPFTELNQRVTLPQPSFSAGSGPRKSRRQARSR